MNAQFLADKFKGALDSKQYLQTGTDEQRRRWNLIYDAVKLTDSQANLVKSFVRQMNLLIVSGIWCGDCVQQCPLIARIAEANPSKVVLRIVDRDQNPDLAEALRLNQGDRIPMLVFMAEDFEFCGAFGDRTISRYRALVRKQLGGACLTGIVVPEKEELNATLADWLAEIERVQLMLRLSARLRQKHGD